jgi:hypothetical protein
MFLRASVTTLLSRWAEDWSILSSVMLKSPRTILGQASLFSCHMVSTWDQNGCWAGLSVGIYIFSIEVSHSSNHLIFSSSALPCWSSCAVYSFGFRIVKATVGLQVNHEKQLAKRCNVLVSSEDILKGDTP